LRAAAAVAGAHMTERRIQALFVFVALVTDAAQPVAAVGRARTIRVNVTLSQATIGERIAHETRLTIRSGGARHAAVTSRIAARQVVRLAVGVGGALYANITSAVQGRRACRKGSAATVRPRCAACACAGARYCAAPAIGAAACAHSTAAAATAARGNASRGDHASLRQRACHARRDRRARQARRASRGRNIELEARVAGLRYQKNGKKSVRSAEDTPGHVTATSYAQGAAVSSRASFTANPCG
jgi:hypothetical protein